MRTPRKLSNGTYRIRFRGPHGRIVQESFRTTKLAEARMRELEGDPQAAARKTVSELISEWRAAHVDTVQIRRATREAYTRALDRLGNEFAAAQLRRVTPADLERVRNLVATEAREKRERLLVANLARNPVTPEREAELREGLARFGIEAANKFLQVARQLFRFGEVRGYLLRNPAGLVKKLRTPRLADEEAAATNVLEPSEYPRLLAHVAPEHRVMARFLFESGCRFGEAMGLKFEDLDFASNKVAIRRQRDRKTGKMVALKTQTSVRAIDLPADLMRDLKAHRLTVGQGETVFRVELSNFRSRVWLPAFRRAGLRSIRVHDARHTHASWLIAAGLDIVEVSRRLGHANAAITLKVYSHQIAKRSTLPVSEKLAQFMASEAAG